MNLYRLSGWHFNQKKGFNSSFVESVKEISSLSKRTFLKGESKGLP